MVANALTADSPLDSRTAHEASATSLDRERTGTVVRVANVTGGDAIARRLVDLGFRPGTEVLVERVAPLGDPVQYRLHGYRLALRRSEAKRVLVTATK